MTVMRDPARILVAAERVIFFIVGAIFFLAAFALAARGLVDLWPLVAGSEDTLIESAARFLNVMLLVLMIVELAYTVIITLRGSILTAEPFLLVGLIAVIRRILVITISEVAPGATRPEPGGITAPSIELLILTTVVLALVGAIVLLRRVPSTDEALDPVTATPMH